MKPHTVIFAALAATSIFALAAQSLEPLPANWIIAGQSPELYKAGIDQSESITGRGAKYIGSIEKENKSWGTLTHAFAAEKYRAKRVQLQARIKTREVSGWAGMWMRVDGPKGITAFYNSQDKPIKGSADWQLRSVVLDVSPDAESIVFGVIHRGSGEVWIDDLKFDVVAGSVPLDSTQLGSDLAEAPSL